MWQCTIPLKVEYRSSQRSLVLSTKAKHISFLLRSSEISTLLHYYTVTASHGIRFEPPLMMEAEGLCSLSYGLG